MSLSISDGYLKELGRMTSQLTILEILVRAFTYELSGMPQKYGRIALRRYSFPSVLQTAKDLAQARLQGDLRESFIAFLNRILKANEKRNTMIHSFWHGDEDRAHRTSVRNLYGVETNLTELTEIADEIGELIQEAIKFPLFPAEPDPVPKPPPSSGPAAGGRTSES